STEDGEPLPSSPSHRPPTSYEGAMRRRRRKGLARTLTKNTHKAGTRKRPRFRFAQSRRERLIGFRTARHLATIAVSLHHRRPPLAKRPPEWIQGALRIFDGYDEHVTPSAESRFPQHAPSHALEFPSAQVIADGSGTPRQSVR